jgi:hypothetical protein
VINKLSKLTRNYVDLFYTNKRGRKARKKGVKLELRRRSRARAVAHSRAKAVVFGPGSVIAKMFSDCATKDLFMEQTSLYLKIPGNFSMLEAPEDAISLIASFARIHQNRSLSDVFVDLSEVKIQDLGAHALLDRLVDEIVSQASFQNTRVGWRGNFPADPAQRRFIKAMGIVSQLGLAHKYLEFGEAEKVHRFERKCRHYLRQIKAVKPEDKSEQANAAERFANHVNRCLARENRELTLEGRSRLCNYVVEVIDNAENHAGMIDWTIQGYVDMAMAEPQCEIVIFNFGKSIADTLEALPPDGYTMGQIQEYLDLHENQGWFGPKWRREDLLTLIALQGSVSRKNSSSDTTRGQGTADLIEFFQQMNDEREVEGLQSASMYIVSGTTRVLFDPKYRIGTTQESSRVIAFNVENDLKLPPDPACVKPLRDCRLPGTMIGIKFQVQASILRHTEPAESTK